MIFPREFYIPKGAVKVVDKQSDAVAYLWTSAKSGKPGASIFFGKQSKPVSNYYYRNEQSRENAVSIAFTNRRAWQARNSARAAERKAFVNPYKVGDIFRTCWGYEQTNVEYFEAVEIRGKHVILREIAQSVKQSGFMQGSCTPLPGSYVGEPIRRLAQDGHVKIDEVRTAWPMKPEMIAGVPVYGTASWSSYH